jgi:hypothetical protein
MPKASKVLVTHADGTQQIRPAYNLPQLRVVLDGGTPRTPKVPRKPPDDVLLALRASLDRDPARILEGVHYARRKGAAQRLRSLGASPGEIAVRVARLRSWGSYQVDPWELVRRWRELAADIPPDWSGRRCRPRWSRPGAS